MIMNQSVSLRVVTQTALVGILLSLFCEIAAAQHVSNGGNYVSTEFITRARLIYSFLGDNPRHSVNAHVNRQLLQKAIDSTVVEVSSQVMPRDTMGREVDAFVAPFPCTRIGECRIVLRRSFWNDALRANQNIYRLVLHEYLRVLGIHDENNEVSSQLEMDADYMGRSGIIEIADLANLDFDTPNDGFELPLYWYISAVNLGYRISVDTTKSQEGPASLKIASDFNRAPLLAVPGAQPFAASVQCFDAKPYWGHAIHLSGYINTTNLSQGSAGLWMRVDGVDGSTRLLDNMSNRAVYGTTSWKRVDVIVYVDDNVASQVCFGALLFGVGAANFDSLRLRVIEDH